VQEHKIIQSGSGAKQPSQAPAPPTPRPIRGRAPTLELPDDSDWREKDAKLLELAREGKKQGGDRSLGSNNANGALRRKLKAGDQEHDFVLKARKLEHPEYRVGTPELAPREQAAYELDALLGDGRVVPASAALDVIEGFSTGRKKGGALQAFVPGASDIADGGYQIADISSDDFARHPDVQRMTVLDVLMGHEDRHHGNVMFSWDDSGNRGIENLRFHAIDNGYSFAEGHEKQSKRSFDVRDPWMAAVHDLSEESIKDRWKIQKAILRHIPEKIHEQLKKVKLPDMLEKLVASGIKDESALRAAAVRLRVLQDNPEVLKSFIDRHRDSLGGFMDMPRSAAQQGQMEFQYQSHKNPHQLLRDHTDLEPDAYDQIVDQVRAAL
jgi:hypothetical protein